jgi:general secretion pathway protein G
MNMIEKRKQMRGQGGFTLIELLVVIAILGILAGVVVFAVGNLTGDAKDSACEIELRTLETAVEAAKGSSNPSDTYSDFLKAGDTPEYWTVSGTTISNVAAKNTGSAATGCVIP